MSEQKGWGVWIGTDCYRDENRNVVRTFLWRLVEDGNCVKSGYDELSKELAIARARLEKEKILEMRSLIEESFFVALD